MTLDPHSKSIIDERACLLGDDAETQEDADYSQGAQVAGRGYTLTIAPPPGSATSEPDTQTLIPFGSLQPPLIQGVGIDEPEADDEDEFLEAPILDQFKEWMNELDSREPRSQVDEVGSRGELDIVNEFTALRQDVKLQAKSARGVVDRVEAAFDELRAATELMNTHASVAEQSAADHDRFASALCDLDEAFQRGRHELRKALDTSSNCFGFDEAALGSDLDAEYSKLGWLAQRKMASYHQNVIAIIRKHLASSNQVQTITALLEGMQFLLTKLERVMADYQLSRIECQGQPIDPHCMNVVDVVDRPSLQAGTVVDEVRSGYRRGDKVFRVAHVIAVKGT